MKAVLLLIVVSVIVVSARPPPGGRGHWEWIPDGRRPSPPPHGFGPPGPHGPHHGPHGHHGHGPHGHGPPHHGHHEEQQPSTNSTIEFPDGDIIDDSIVTDVDQEIEVTDQPLDETIGGGSGNGTQGEVVIPGIPFFSG